jgi:hypothetical protein
LKGWFNRHQFQPVTSAIFLNDIRQNLVKGDKALDRKLMLDRWVYQPGVPANAIHVQSAAFTRVDAAARAFAETGDAAAIPGDMVTQETLRFISDLPRAIGTAKLTALDQRFHWSTTGNSEIRFAWLRLALASHYPPATASASEFLTGQGRLKFVVPLYSELMKQGEWGPALARKIYAAARPGYHPIAQGAIESRRTAEKLVNLGLTGILIRQSPPAKHGSSEKVPRTVPMGFPRRARPA